MLADRMAYSWHLKQKVCLIRYCVFWSPFRRNFRLSLYRADREISKVCLQIIFVPIEIGLFRTSIHGNCFGHGNKNIYTWRADTFSNDVIMS